MEPAEEVERYLETGQLDGVYRLRFWKGAFHLWQKGRYVELRNSEVRAHVVNHLNRRYSHLSTSALGNVMVVVGGRGAGGACASTPAISAVTAVAARASVIVLWQALVVDGGAFFN